MADYWKSTPKYWCKHCSMYVADTKVSRANHDATGKHQSAVKRALRDLHRDHERQEREKERAKREVERLNGLVGESAGGASSTTSKPGFRKAAPPPPSQAPQGPPVVARDQLEQLVDLGVSIPDQFRGELAMAGDWTVTETRIIEDAGTKKDGSARAVGIRKRTRGDGEDDTQPGGQSEFDKLDVDAAVQGLFKKPRTWGRDSRTMPGGGAADGDLDSLLSSALQPKSSDEGVKDVKTEVKTEVETEVETALDPLVKREDTGGLNLPPAQEDTKVDEPAVVFKKRKSKSSRK